MTDSVPLARTLFKQQEQARFRTTDRVMGWLLMAQWLFSIGLELFGNPSTWNGATSRPSDHLLGSIGVGALVTLFPVYLCFFQSGSPAARYSATIAQMVWSALLIHFTGGQIETHFHVFVSLAILSNYRDWKVLLLATAVVLLHHGILGTMFPESVFGSANPGRWRWVEHALWVAFEDAVLIWFCITGTREMEVIASREAQLQITKESIEQQVIDRTKMLELAMHEANRANEAKNQILTNMSHEVRTPLYGVLGNLKLLTRCDFNEEITGYIRDSITSARMLAHVINNILTLSEIESGRLYLRSVETDFKDSIQEICEAYEQTAAVKGIELLLDSPEDCVGVGDPRRIRQIAGNLLSNGIKFTDKGFVSVSFWFEEEKNGVGRLVIRVADTGRGISQDQRTALFDSFHQEDYSSTRTIGGLGVGLAICAKLVGLMNGTISVESAPGKGSTFTVSLPTSLVGNSAKAHNPRASLLGASTLRGTALVVGSVPVAVKALELCLRRFGMESSGFCGPLDRLPQESLNQCDVAVIEVRDRDELKTLSRRFLYQQVRKIVLISADVCSEDELETAFAADTVLLRPVDIRRLHDVIQDLTSERIAEAA